MSAQVSLRTCRAARVPVLGATCTGVSANPPAGQTCSLPSTPALMLRKCTRGRAHTCSSPVWWTAARSPSSHKDGHTRRAVSHCNTAQLSKEFSGSSMTNVLNVRSGLQDVILFCKESKATSNPYCVRSFLGLSEEKAQKNGSVQVWGFSDIITVRPCSKWS